MEQDEVLCQCSTSDSDDQTRYLPVYLEYAVGNEQKSYQKHPTIAKSPLISHLESKRQGGNSHQLLQLLITTTLGMVFSSVNKTWDITTS